VTVDGGEEEDPETGTACTLGEGTADRVETQAPMKTPATRSEHETARNSTARGVDQYRNERNSRRLSRGTTVQQFCAEVAESTHPEVLFLVATKRVPGGVVHKLPQDLRDALIANPKALAAWFSITPLARNEFICWVEDAKQAQTRERRIRRTKEELEEGQRRPCCWPGCSHRERTGK
jgi:hypothetical protein